MKQSDLIKWGGCVGMIGAVLLIIGAIIHPPVETLQTIVTDAWVWGHVLLGKGVVLSLVGLTAVFLKMAEKGGAKGVWGYALSFFGLTGLLFIVYFAALIEPVIGRSAPALLAMDGPLFQGLLGPFFMITVISYVVGFLLFGSAVWKSNKNKVLGTALILGALPFLMFFINPETPEWVYNTGIVVTAVGLFGLSRQVWSGK